MPTISFEIAIVTFCCLSAPASAELAPLGVSCWDMRASLSSPLSARRAKDGSEAAHRTVVAGTDPIHAGRKIDSAPVLRAKTRLPSRGWAEPSVATRWRRGSAVGRVVRRRAAEAHRQLGTRPYAQLAVGLAQMVLDRARAEHKALRHLLVRRPAQRRLGHARLLRRQLAPGIVDVGRLVACAGCAQLVQGAVRPQLRA